MARPSWVILGGAWLAMSLTIGASIGGEPYSLVDEENPTVTTIIGVRVVPKENGGVRKPCGVHHSWSPSFFL